MALAGEKLEELGPAEIDAEDLSNESPEAELSVCPSAAARAPGTCTSAI